MAGKDKAERIPATREQMQRVLDELPQKPPFRFLDEIVELSNEHIVGKYTFKQDEWFYKGHFPDRPVTPGVILIECIAQSAVVALGLHQHFMDGGTLDRMTLFSDCEIEFSKVVNPGDTVYVKARKLFFRRYKLKSEATLEFEDGSVAASGTLSGIGVKLEDLEE